MSSSSSSSSPRWPLRFSLKSPLTWSVSEHVALAAYVARWFVLVAPVAVAIGSLCALFLWTLDLVTHVRVALPWLLFLLPAGGLLIGAIYHWFGRSVEGGNNLIMEQIHEPGGGVPGRMTPLVLVGTVLTHLFGGSAGREGTAVQMGGSIASTFSRRLNLDVVTSRTLLTAGIAAGFGAVFGTPLTGAVFALEVLAIGRMDYEALIPCLLASLIGDWTCAAWGIHHTAYHVASLKSPAFAHFDPLLLGKAVVAAVCFGLVSVVFAELTHSINRIFKRLIRWPMLRPVAGGVILIALVFVLGTRDYLGLGVTSTHPGGVSIVSSFAAGGVTPWSWWWKLLFTAVTLGSGFKGGEVTPLFFIGAALGNVLGHFMGAPVDLFAALGFVAVFAGATNTPLACTLMGIELFGADIAVYVAATCFFAYVFSGHSGIYLSQRIGTAKGDAGDLDLDPGTSLRSVRDLREEHRDQQLPRTSFTPLPTTSPTLAPATELYSGDTSMPHRHTIRPRKVGHVRIYLTPRERRRRGGLKNAMFGKALYAEIIDTAKTDGIPHAVAHHHHYGYSGSGEQIQTDSAEYPNQKLTMCVELIGPTHDLELFIRKHGDLLQGKMILHKDAENWDIFAVDSQQKKEQESA